MKHTRGARIAWASTAHRREFGGLWSPRLNGDRRCAVVPSRTALFQRGDSMHQVVMVARQRHVGGIRVRLFVALSKDGEVHDIGQTLKLCALCGVRILGVRSSRVEPSTEPPMIAIARSMGEKRETFFHARHGEGSQFPQHKVNWSRAGRQRRGRVWGAGRGSHTCSFVLDCLKGGGSTYPPRSRLHGAFIPFSEQSQNGLYQPRPPPHHRRCRRRRRPRLRGATAASCASTRSSSTGPHDRIRDGDGDVVRPGSAAPRHVGQALAPFARSGSTHYMGSVADCACVEARPCAPT